MKDPRIIYYLVMVAVVIFFVLIPHIFTKRKIRCHKCGLSATFVGSDDVGGIGIYMPDVYRCPNGHETSP